MPRDGMEIEQAEMSVRRKRAKISSTPSRGAPASAPIAGAPCPSGDGGQTDSDAHVGSAPVAPIEPAETSVRKRRAGIRLTPMVREPGVSPIGRDESSGREQRAKIEPTPSEAAPAAPPIGLDDDPDRELRTNACATPKELPSSVPPIGPAKRRGRPRKAKTRLTPSHGAPSVAPIDQDHGSDRERRANRLPTPNSSSPAAPPIGHNGNAVVGGDGQLSLDSHTDAAISATINELIGAQKRRRFAITEKNRSERAIEALIAGFMGFRLDATEKDRKAVYARAKAFRLASEDGKTNDDHDNHNLAALVPTIIVSSASRQQWWNLKEKAEKDLKRLVKRLPVYDFADGVRGFGALGLAVLTAEAGMPIGDYPTVSKLWKRMGLAVMGDKDQWVADGDGWERIGEPARNDKRQQKCRDEVEAIIHGYVPRRRAEVWAFCSDSMFRGQWKGANEETGEPAGPRGPYGEVYARRRAQTEPRIAATAHLPAGNREKWTPGRCHNDARRIMSKALLRDLWRVWRGMPPRGSSPID